jgi:menaquinone-dependent protoporphyrinogen IX oxidase
MKDLVKDDSLMVSNRYFATDLEKGIESIRDEWRQKNEVAENATVIFFAPGNEHNEAEFATENVRRGVKEFLMKYSAPTSLSPKALPINNFVTVISLHSGSDGEKYVREYLKENEWYGKVIFVSD